MQTALQLHSGPRIVPGLPARSGVLSSKRRPIFKFRAAAPVEAENAVPEPEYETAVEDVDPSTRAFPYPLPKDPAQQALSSIPLMVFLPAMAAAVAGAGFVGSVIGRAAPVEPEQKDITSVGAAVVCVAAAAYGAVQAKRKRDSTAVVDLYNAIVDLPDPNDLTVDIVQEVGSKYGINMHKDELDGLKRIYGQFLESCIPLGDVQLKGDEADKIRAFKESLGLSDEDAAPVHIEVGRRFNREGFETKDRGAVFEKRKAFQRLIYVSQLVYGDQKAAFLLPWRRHFNLNDAQVFVARRDNARAIFRAYLESKGGVLTADRHFLHDLRERQVAVKLMDDVCEEVIREYARKKVEGHLQKAIDAVRATAKSKDIPTAVAEVRHILDYSRKLVRLANEDDLVPGLGTVTLQGGALAGEAKSREVKDVYRVYIEENMMLENQFTAALDADAKELATIFCLGAKDSKAIVDEVAAKLYRRLLREEVVSGRLDAAASPASVLQTLCDKVRFSPEAAMDMHRQLYKQKLASLTADKKKLSDADDADLKRVRRILCISPDIAKKVQKEVCGKELEEVISDIYLLGAKPLSSMEADKVDKVIKDLRLEQDVCMEVMTSVTREKLRSYITAAQKEQRDRREYAGIIKKMIQFNALVVTPVLDRIKGVEAAKKELADMLAKAMEDAKEEAEEAAAKEGGAEASASTSTSQQPSEDNVAQVRKAIQAARGEAGEEERKAQKEINLKDDLDAKNKAEIYKNYLMYSMTGDVVELPVGGTIRKKANLGARQTEMARLQSLADVLGMTQMEVMGVQSELAEQAYKAQAQEVMKSGPMSEEKVQYLEEIRNQLGLGKEQADKALKAVRVEVYGSSAAAEEGQWTLERVMEMSGKGANIDSLMEEVTRRNIFRKELQKKVADGTGELDPEFFLQKLPQLLVLPEYKVKQIIKEEVGSRKRTLLVQAVSQFRQRRVNETVISLNNLLSCVGVMPEDKPMPWSERAELSEVYVAFCAKEDSAVKRDRLRSLLGLSEEEAATAASATAIEVARAKAEDDDDNFL